MAGGRFWRAGAMLVLMGISLISAGCWDLRELQDRNFVMAIGIDDAAAGEKKPEELARERAETFVQHQGEKQYRVSFQILKLAPTSAQGEQSPSPAKTFVYSNTGSSIIEMIRDTLGQSSKALYFEHLQTIILSEAALRKNGLKPLLDLFRRDSEMRWRIRLLVTPDEAKPLLEYNPPTGEPGGRYFVGIINTHRKNLHIPGVKTDLGFVSQALANQGDVMIPRVIMEGKTVKVGGAALFKKDQFVGYVDEYTVRGMKFIYGTEKSAVIPVECPEHPGGVFVYELFDHQTKLTSHIERDQIYYSLDIFMQGNLAEVQCSSMHPSDSPELLRQAEAMVAQEVEKNAVDSIKTLQGMGVDPLKFKDLLKGEHPKEWEQIKDRWEEMYPQIPLQVFVKVNIRQLGELRQ